MSSNITSSSSNYTYVPLCFNIQIFINFYSAVQWLDVPNVILGFILNSWLLFTILTSNDLRSRMRNKMLSGICLQNLFECIAFLPLSIHLYAKSIKLLSRSCLEMRAFNFLFFFNEFTANWNLVLILTLAVSTVMAANISSKINSLVVKIGTYCLVLMPWLFSVAIVTPVIFSDYKEYVYTRTSNNLTLCYSNMFSVRKPLYYINIGVPAILIVSLLVSLVILKWRKRSQERTMGDMSRQLIGQTPETDELLPYVLSGVIFFICDFGLMLNIVRINYRTQCTAVILKSVQNILEGFRVYLQPLSFLFFPEIRYRAWKLILRVIRPARSSDISMTYIKET